MNEDISRIFGSFIVVELMTVFGLSPLPSRSHPLPPSADSPSGRGRTFIWNGREFRLASLLLRVSMGGFVALLLYMRIRGLNIPVNDYLAIFSSGVIGTTVASSSA